MAKKLIISNIEFNKKKPLIIAEIGNNHQGDIVKCEELFYAAKRAGVDAVKLQKRDNKKLFTNEKYIELYNSENAFSSTYGKHRDFLEFGKKEFIFLKKLAKKLDLIFFATPFDLTSADFLHKEIDLPAFKLASADIHNLQLIEKLIKFKKPLIISTGGADLLDIKRVCNLFKKYKFKNFSIMQCTASYPCETKDLNLGVIKYLDDYFKDILIGLSSHHNGISTEITGYMLGARVFEKHFTMNRSWKGTDHSFSLEPAGMKKLVRDIKRIPISIGSSKKKELICEKIPLNKMRKNIVINRSIKKFEKIKEQDISLKCAGYGLSAVYFQSIIGKRINKDLKKDQVLEFNYFKKLRPILEKDKNNEKN